MIAPLTLLDTFTRTVSGSWGTMDSGQAWSGGHATFAVNGTYGTMTVAANDSYKTLHVDLDDYGIPKQGSAEIVTLVRWTGSAAFPTTDFGPILSRSASNTFYYSTLQGNYNECALGCYMNGTRVELNRGSASLVKNTWYWVRFRRDSSGLKLRIWKRDTAEPSAWTLTSNLSFADGAPSNGDIGMWRRGTNDAYSIDVDTFYGYTLEEDNPLPVTDTFERDVHEGWGISDSKHTWEGNFAHDPAVYVRGRQGSVIDAANGSADYVIDTTDNYLGVIGPSVSGDAELLVQVSTNTNLGNTWADFGICGTWDAPNGDARFAGYVVRFKSAMTTLSILKRPTLGGSLTTQATSAAFTAVAANSLYWLRLQKTGTTVRARIWLDGTSEPITWNVSFTDGTPLTNGQSFVNITQDVAAAKRVNIYSWTFARPTPASTTYTGTGALTSTAITDTTLALRAAFTNDSNSNNSITVEYKPTSEQEWTTFGGTKTRVASPLSYTFTLTGLTYNTPYHVRVTFNDVDIVSGTNPVIGTFTTSANSVSGALLSVPTIDGTTATVTLTYEGDADNDSTATLDYRVSAKDTDIINDPLYLENYTLLSDRVAPLGGRWLRHLASADRHALGYDYAVLFNQGAQNEKVVYYNDYTLPSQEYIVRANLFFPFGFVAPAKIGIAARMSETADTMYLGRWNATATTWELVKVINGVETVLGSSPSFVIMPSVNKLELAITNAAKTFYVDGVQQATSADNTIASGTRAGLFFQETESTPPVEHFAPRLNQFAVLTRTTSGSFTGSGAMTADRPNKTFTRNVTGLTADTNYEFRATLADGDGVRGPTQFSVVAQTIGQAVKLLSVAATTQQTTAVIDTAYDFDTNQNSTLSVQYRNIMDYLWTTLPSNRTVADRTAKKFQSLLTSLKPNATYEVTVTVSDPNGLIQGSAPSITSTFSTKGYMQETDKQDKHYLWKVYDPNGTFITTWTDVGAPEYSWQENGGVSDLRVTLHRRISSIDNAQSGVAFQNRVDIWCFDPSSDGMGINLVPDGDFTQGAWQLGSNANISDNGGPDDSSCLSINAATSTQQTTRSSAIFLHNEESILDDPTTLMPVPLVLTAIARATKSKLVLSIEAYDINELKIDESPEFAETVGPEWQQLRVEYLPPRGTRYLRVAVKNDAAGLMWIDKVEIKAKEVLIYRGRIETFTPTIDRDGERIEVDILGLVSLLSDDYIEHLQFVTIQPQKDITAQRKNLGPMDPAEMLRIAIDEARKQNPAFSLYYTSESIHNTGSAKQYTFRNQQLRAIFDKVRSLCPPSWHYYVEPDGLVVLRGPEHTNTHYLRRGVEIADLSIEKSIRNLKNYVQVKGRQDEDNTENDGNGSIWHVAFDQESIDKYGKRVLHIQDANIIDPETAETVAEGRLEEHNREEQRAQCQIYDEKQVPISNAALRGYNVESFRPGDQVLIVDPVGGPRLSYWDSMVWDQDKWDYDNVFSPLPDPVPVKKIEFHGTYVDLELSERLPSGVSEFGRLYRWLQTKDAEQGD